MRSDLSISLEPERFAALAAYLAARGDADMFLSGLGYPGETNSLVGFGPYDELIVTEETSKKDIAAFAFSTPDPTFGFLSYPYGRITQGVTPVKSSKFPLGYLKKYSTIITYSVNTMILTIAGEPNNIPAILKKTDISGPMSSPVIDHSSLESVNLRQSLERDDYIEGVKKALEYIRSGYIYQLNLTIKYSAEAANLDTAWLFMHLWKAHPAPFYAYFCSGSNKIISTSPERFLKVENGKVLSQPIKGTLAFDKYDESLISKLVDSPKEAAELSMIVDMIRNDISLNCQFGSVRVENHKSTFVVDKMLQMYSNVRGELKPESTCIDLLFDAFPGGSITGCPKKMAMTLIDELEPHTRDVYCGAFFVIHDKKNMDSSIAIRTGYYNEEEQAFNFYAGSGIVVDSDPEREYLETTAKASKFLNILGR